MSTDIPDNLSLKAMFDYDPLEGFLRWKNQPYIPSNRRGVIAGYIDDSARKAIIVRINKRHYRATHIIWCLVTGKWPQGQVRHRNNQQHDNRFANLYLAGRKHNPPWDLNGPVGLPPNTKVVGAGKLG